MSLGPDEEFCRSCGDRIKKAAVRCPSCGVNTNSGPSSTAGEVFCESCGESIKAEAEICPNCGVSQQSSGFDGSSDAADLIYYGQIVVGGFLLLAALGSITDFSDGVLASIGGFVGYGLIGLLLIPQVRENFEKRHPVTTFGWTTNVEERTISDSSEPCSSCFDEITSGVQRSFGKELVVAGVTLQRKTDGMNHYCNECLSVEESLEQARSIDVDSTD